MSSDSNRTGTRPAFDPGNLWILALVGLLDVLLLVPLWWLDWEWSRGFLVGFFVFYAGAGLALTCSVPVAARFHFLCSCLQDRVSPKEPQLRRLQAIEALLLVPAAALILLAWLSVTALVCEIAVFGGAMATG